jgi:hypothetical protein
VQSFADIFKHLCACNNSDLQFRALYIIRSIVKSNQDLATKIVESEVMDVLFAIQNVNDARLVNDKVSLIPREHEDTLIFLFFAESTSGLGNRWSLLEVWSHPTQQRTIVLTSQQIKYNSSI